MREIFSNQSEFERLYKACVTFVKSYTYDEVQAESVASEAMVTFWEKQKTLSEDVPSLPYLLGIARNILLHHLRAQMSDTKHLEQMKLSSIGELQYRLDTLEECDPHALYYEDINIIIAETLSHLSDNARKAFIMSRYYGMSHKEIAMTLGISHKTVEYHISHTISLLRENLKDYLPLISILISI